MATFYLRAVCMNRNIWGAEGFEEISIRHSKFAAGRFAQEAAPALERFAPSSRGSFLDGIKASRRSLVARYADERKNSLRNRGYPNVGDPRSAVIGYDGSGSADHVCRR